VHASLFSRSIIARSLAGLLAHVIWNSCRKGTLQFDNGVEQSPKKGRS
jgi:hypothetical protein